MPARLTLMIAVAALSLPARDLSAQSSGGTLVVRGGTVITVSEGTFRDTDVLVEGGLITAIGKQVEAPAGAREVDARGLYVIPGLVDLFVPAIPAIDAEETHRSITPELRIEDVLDPFVFRVERSLRHGVTVSQISHSPSRLVAGENETIKHRTGSPLPDVLKMPTAPRTMLIAADTGRPVPDDRRSETIRGALLETREYLKRRSAADPGEHPGEAFHSGTPFDVHYETLAGLIAGDFIVFVHAGLEDRRQDLLATLTEFGIENLVCLPSCGSSERIGAIEHAWSASTPSPGGVNSRFDAETLPSGETGLSRSNFRTALYRHDEGDPDTLLRMAAAAQRSLSLDDDAALSLVTLNPATLLGIDAYIGSLHVGKDGDIAIFSHHPLDPDARALVSIVDGIVQFDDREFPPGSASEQR